MAQIASRRTYFRSVRSRGSTAISPPPSLWTVEQRLADVERELSIQFTRIAQLQAALDLLLAAGRRAPDGGRM